MPSEKTKSPAGGRRGSVTLDLGESKSLAEKLASMQEDDEDLPQAEAEPLEVWYWSDGVFKQETMYQNPAHKREGVRIVIPLEVFDISSKGHCKAMEDLEKMKEELDDTNGLLAKCRKGYYKELVHLREMLSMARQQMQQATGQMNAKAVERLQKHLDYIQQTEVFYFDIVEYLDPELKEIFIDALKQFNKRVLQQNCDLKEQLAFFGDMEAPDAARKLLSLLLSDGTRNATMITADYVQVTKDDPDLRAEMFDSFKDSLVKAGLINLEKVEDPQIQILRGEIEKLHTIIQQERDKRENAENQFNDLKEMVSASQQTISDLNAKNIALKKDLETSNKKQSESQADSGKINELKNNLKEYEKQIQDLKKQLKQSEKSAQTAQQQLEQVKQKGSDNQKAVSDMQKVIDEKQLQVDEVTKELQSAYRNAERLEERVKELEAQIANHVCDTGGGGESVVDNTELIRLQEQLEAAEMKCRVLEEDKRKGLEAIESLKSVQDELEKSKQREQALIQEVGEAQQSRMEAEKIAGIAKSSGAAGLTEEMEKELLDTRAEIANLENQAASSKAECVMLQAEVDRLKQQLAAAESKAQQQQAVGATVQAQPTVQSSAVSSVHEPTASRRSSAARPLDEPSRIPENTDYNDLEAEIQRLNQQLADKDAELQTALLAAATSIVDEDDELKRRVKALEELNKELDAKCEEYKATAEMASENGKKNEAHLFTRFLVKHYGSLKAGFEAIDTDQSGELDPQEWHRGLEETGYYHHLSQRLFATFDEDKSGGIDMNELAQMNGDFVYKANLQDHIEREEREWTDAQWKKEVMRLRKEIQILNSEAKNMEKGIMDRVVELMAQGTTFEDAQRLVRGEFVDKGDKEKTISFAEGARPSSRDGARGTSAVRESREEEKSKGVITSDGLGLGDRSQSPAGSMPRAGKLRLGKSGLKPLKENKDIGAEAIASVTAPAPEDVVTETKAKPVPSAGHVERALWSQKFDGANKRYERLLQHNEEVKKERDANMAKATSALWQIRTLQAETQRLRERDKGYAEHIKKMKAKLDMIKSGRMSIEELMGQKIESFTMEAPAEKPDDGQRPSTPEMLGENWNKVGGRGQDYKSRVSMAEGEGKKVSRWRMLYLDGVTRSFLKRNLENKRLGRDIALENETFVKKVKNLSGQTPQCTPREREVLSLTRKPVQFNMPREKMVAEKQRRAPAISREESQHSVHSISESPRIMGGWAQKHYQAPATQHLGVGGTHVEGGKRIIGAMSNEEAAAIHRSKSPIRRQLFEVYGATRPRTHSESPRRFPSQQPPRPHSMPPHQLQFDPDNQPRPFSPYTEPRPVSQGQPASRKGLFLAPERLARPTRSLSPPNLRALFMEQEHAEVSKLRTESREGRPVVSSLEQRVGSPERISRPESKDSTRPMLKHVRQSLEAKWAKDEAAKMVQQRRIIHSVSPKPKTPQELSFSHSAGMVLETSKGGGAWLEAQGSTWLPDKAKTTTTKKDDRLTTKGFDVKRPVLILEREPPKANRRLSPNSNFRAQVQGFQTGPTRPRPQPRPASRSRSPPRAETPDRYAKPSWGTKDVSSKVAPAGLPAFKGSALQSTNGRIAAGQSRLAPGVYRSGKTPPVVDQPPPDQHERQLPPVTLLSGDLPKLEMMNKRSVEERAQFRRDVKERDEKITPSLPVLLEMPNSFKQLKQPKKNRRLMFTRSQSPKAQTQESFFRRAPAGWTKKAA